MRTTTACVLFLLISNPLTAQDVCSCPALNTCFACSGGLTYLKLKYTDGGIITDMSASDDSGVLTTSFQNGIITINSSVAGQPFTGDVTVTVSRLLEKDDKQVFKTLCSSNTYAGQHIRHFDVVEGASVAGPLCCEDSEMDKTPPQFVKACPANILVAAGNTCTAAVTWTPPTASDNCGNVTLTTTNNPGDVFNAGITTVTYTAKDDYNNTKTCSFTVEVKDQTKPVITNCPSNLSVSTGASSCNATVTWTAPNATDNCGVTSFSSNKTSGSIFPVGITTVTYTATDAAGNSAICSFTVTVTDKTLPLFTSCVTSDIIVNSDCNAVVNWTAPVATDNCSAVTLTNTHKPGDTFAAGTTIVTYTAKDAAGNSATCTFRVIVNDKTGPVFSNCPTNIHTAASQACTVVVNWTPPTAKDNCSDAKIISSHTPGSAFGAGVTHVTYTATDAAGNSSVCGFDIIVDDARVATISNCPPDIQAKADESGNAIVSWIPPAATTTCGTVSLASTHSPGDSFPVGTTEVAYTIPGNTISCKFHVVVSPAEVSEDPEDSFDVVQLVSPNGDGINDVWQLPHIEQFKDNKVILMDRWGGVVYEASGYNNESVAWKGNNTSGASVPPGTYFYVITVQYNSRELKRKGFIELIR